MLAVNKIVKVAISSTNVAVKEPGFGVACIVDGHSRFPERIRFYSEPAAMLTDGFLSSDPAYLAALKLYSQAVQPTQFAVARRALAPTMQITLTPVASNSKAYEVEINGVKKTFTSDGTATVSEIVVGLIAAIGAITGFTVAAVGGAGTETALTITGNAAGNWVRVKALDSSLIGVAQTHADPGIATDLAAIVLESDAFFALMLTTASKAEILAAAAWVETKKKIMVQAHQDSVVITTAKSGTDDVAEGLQATTPRRAALVYSADNGEFKDAAILGKCLPKNPGSVTFALKNLAGVTADNLTETHVVNLEAKGCNYYASFNGTSLFMPGIMAGGEYIDVTRDTDWFESRLQARVFGDLANADKTPFTDAGIAKVEAQLRAQCAEAIASGFLAADPAPTFTIPKASAVSTTDKNNRKLTGVRFKATIAGAIHSTEIDGQITV